MTLSQRLRCILLLMLLLFSVLPITPHPAANLSAACGIVSAQCGSVLRTAPSCYNFPPSYEQPTSAVTRSGQEDVLRRIRTLFWVLFIYPGGNHGTRGNPPSRDTEMMRKHPLRARDQSSVHRFSHWRHLFTRQMNVPFAPLYVV